MSNCYIPGLPGFPGIPGSPGTPGTPGTSGSSLFPDKTFFVSPIWYSSEGVEVSPSYPFFNAIQDAVDAASISPASAIIIVYPGVYDETVTLISGMSLVGYSFLSVEITTVLWTATGITDNVFIQNVIIQNATITLTGASPAGPAYNFQTENCLYGGLSITGIPENPYPVALIENCIIIEFGDYSVVQSYDNLYAFITVDLGGILFDYVSNIFNLTVGEVTAGLAYMQGSLIGSLITNDTYTLTVNNGGYVIAESCDFICFIAVNTGSSFSGNNCFYNLVGNVTDAFIDTIGGSFIADNSTFVMSTSIDNLGYNIFQLGNCSMRNSTFSFPSVTINNLWGALFLLQGSADFSGSTFNLPTFNSATNTGGTPMFNVAGTSCNMNNCTFNISGSLSDLYIFVWEGSGPYLTNNTVFEGSNLTFNNPIFFTNSGKWYSQNSTFNFPGATNASSYFILLENTSTFIASGSTFNFGSNIRPIILADTGSFANLVNVTNNSAAIILVEGDGIADMNITFFGLDTSSSPFIFSPNFNDANYNIVITPTTTNSITLTSTSASGFSVSSTIDGLFNATVIRLSSTIT